MLFQLFSHFVEELIKALPERQGKCLMPERKACILQ